MSRRFGTFHRRSGAIVLSFAPATAALERSATEHSGEWRTDFTLTR